VENVGQVIFVCFFGFVLLRVSELSVASISLN